MPHTSFLRNHGKTSRTPRRPFEKERLDNEMKLIGEFGLKNKREVFRTQLTLARIRKAARTLLTLEEKDSRRMFEGGALLRRLLRLGVLDETKQQLDYVLALKPADFLERRLQTQVFKLGLAKSIHHARVLIRHRHIRVGKQIVNIPSFMVRTDSQKHIDFAVTSPYGGGRPGRKKRKSIASGGGGGGGGGDDEDMEVGHPAPRPSPRLGAPFSPISSSHLFLPSLRHRHRADSLPRVPSPCAVSVFDILLTRKGAPPCHFC